jgi:DNA-binding transcriptional regulator GbsR (MarR family)
LDYYSKIAIVKNKYWTRERILKNIKEWYSQKKELNSQKMQKGRDRDLFDAAKNIFGSWANAIKNAGLNYQDIAKLKSQTKEYKENLMKRLDNEKLKCLVLNKKMTQLEIADDYNTSPSIIANRMKKLGLPTLNKKFASHQRAIAKDGHKVDSRYEKRVDDWFYENNLRHEVHKRIVNNRNFSADFLVLDRFYIEVLGLWGMNNYKQNYYKKEMAFLMQEGAGFIILDDSTNLEKHMPYLKQGKKVLILLKPDKNHQITKDYLNKRLGFLKFFMD